MPDDNNAKTASAPKAKFNWLYSLPLILIFILLLGVLGPSWLTKDSCREQYRADGVLKIKDKTFQYEAAVTEPERNQGLSGKKCINDNVGMLFVFDQPAAYCFWMKDMNFAVDMIWLDTNKKIVHLQSNAKPSSYPHSFCPNAPSSFVIELKKGSIQDLKLEAGDSVIL